MSISEHACTGVGESVVGRWLLYEYEGPGGLVSLVRAAAPRRGELPGRSLPMMREQIAASIFGDLELDPGGLPTVFECANDGTFLRYGVDFEALECIRAAHEAHLDETKTAQRALTEAPSYPAAAVLHEHLAAGDESTSSRRIAYHDHGPGWLAAQVASPWPLSDTAHRLQAADGAVYGAYRLVEYEGRNGHPLVLVLPSQLGEGLRSRPLHLIRDDIAERVFGVYSVVHSVVAEPHGDEGCMEYAVDMLAVAAEDAEMHWFSAVAFPGHFKAEHRWLTQLREFHKPQIYTVTPVTERGVRAALEGPTRGQGLLGC